MPVSVPVRCRTVCGHQMVRARRALMLCSGGYGNGEHDGRRPQICLTRAIGRVWLTASANAHARVDVRQTTHTDADADAGTGTGRASRKSRALRTWQDESYVRKLCTHAPSAWRASASARARAASGFQVSRFRGFGWVGGIAGSSIAFLLEVCSATSDDDTPAMVRCKQRPSSRTEGLSATPLGESW